MEKLKTMLLKLNSQQSIKYLSLIYFITEENIHILNNYITENNIDINNLCCKTSRIYNIREELTINEISIINDLNLKFLDNFILIYNFFLEDDNNEVYLLFLKNIENQVTKNIALDEIKNQVEEDIIKNQVEEDVIKNQVEEDIIKNQVEVDI
tara:strand:+ start:4716 stop:5174 length:459 start_codon:yes stop_codon:yes gene_type:complete